MKHGLGEEIQLLEALRSNHPINKIWIAEAGNALAYGKCFNWPKKKGLLLQFVPRKKLDQLAAGYGSSRGLSLCSCLPLC